MAYLDFENEPIKLVELELALTSCISNTTGRGSEEEADHVGVGAALRALTGRRSAPFVRRMQVAGAPSV